MGFTPNTSNINVLPAGHYSVCSYALLIILGNSNTTSLIVYQYRRVQYFLAKFALVWYTIIKRNL